MSLTLIVGSRRIANAEVLRRAAQVRPSLIIDGGNCADPHRMLTFTDAEALDDIYVIETELIYKLRDTIVRLRELIRQFGVRHVYFTTFDALFHYQDKEENEDLYVQIWLLLKRAALNNHITIAIKHNSQQQSHAKHFARGATWVILS